MMSIPVCPTAMLDQESHCFLLRDSTRTKQEESKISDTGGQRDKIIK